MHILRIAMWQNSLHRVGVGYPGPRGFLLILSFFIWKFATRSADRSAEPGEKEKPLVATVENLTFMLAQHLTAVKDVIFFLPITYPKIFNPSTHMTRRESPFQFIYVWITSLKNTIILLKNLNILIYVYAISKSMLVADI